MVLGELAIGGHHSAVAAAAAAAAAAAVPAVVWRRGEDLHDVVVLVAQRQLPKKHVYQPLSIVDDEKPHDERVESFGSQDLIRKSVHPLLYPGFLQAICHHQEQSYQDVEHLAAEGGLVHVFYLRISHGRRISTFT